MPSIKSGGKKLSFPITTSICIHLYYANNKSCFLGKTRSKECSNKNVEKIEEYDVIGRIGGVGVIDGG